MKQKTHKATSKAANNFVEPYKPSHKQKIIEGLKMLRVGATYQELSGVTGLREDQIWKRMVDLCRDGDVFDTHTTRKLRSGLSGTVWQLTDLSQIDNSPRPLPPITHTLQLELL